MDGGRCTSMSVSPSDRPEVHRANYIPSRMPGNFFVLPWTKLSVQTNFRNMQNHKITKLSTCVYTPWCNGQTERANRTILNALSFMYFVDERQQDWDVLLPYVLFAIRTAKHASTKQSPFFQLYGREPRTPQDICLGQPVLDIAENLKVRMKQFPAEMQQAWKFAKLAFEKAQASMKTQHDRNAKDPADHINAGDKVYIFKPNPRKGLSPKLQRNYKGPNRVVELTPTNARIVPVDAPTAKPQLVHVNRLKKAKYQDHANDEIGLSN